MTLLASIIVLDGRNTYQTVDSVLRQSYRALECLVVGRDVEARLADVRDPRWRSVAPDGDRRNAGARASQGAALMVVSAGDTLVREAVANLVHALQDGADVAYSDVWLQAGDRRCRLSMPGFSMTALENARILPVSYMTRWTAWAALGGWQQAARRLADLDFFFRAARASARFIHVPEALLEQRCEANDVVRGCLAHKVGVLRDCVQSH